MGCDGTGRSYISLLFSVLGSSGGRCVWSAVSRPRSSGGSCVAGEAAGKRCWINRERSHCTGCEIFGVLHTGASVLLKATLTALNRL